MAESSSSRLVLALDTSTDQLACAVARLASEADGVHGIEVLAARDHLCRRHANEELADCARAALAEAGLCMEDVDQVLVGRGPGSFTGVRIAVATAKGLVCGLGKPLHGGSTLDAVAWTAWQAGVRGRLAVANDAMRGEVYPGIYLLDAAGAHRTFPGETVTKADACVEAWTHLAERDELQLTGNGLFKYRARFEAAGFLPVYTRLSDAEENERKRLGLKQPASVEVTGVDDALADAHLQLRPMSVNDLDQVAAMEASVFAGAAHTAWTRNMFYEELSQSSRSWWVAHDQGTVIGYAGGQMAGDDFEITDVVVAPERRRQGIAARLVSRVAYDAQMLNAATISLEVEEGNRPAQALYARLGFEEVGRRPRYYAPDVAALIMRAGLPLQVDADMVGARPEPHASIRPWPIIPGERTEQTKAALVQAGDLILAIESSCDETAMAIIDSHGQICANVVARGAGDCLPQARGGHRGRVRGGHGASGCPLWVRHAGPGRPGGRGSYRGPRPRGRSGGGRGFCQGALCGYGPGADTGSSPGGSPLCQSVPDPGPPAALRGQSGVWWQHHAGACTRLGRLPDSWPDHRRRRPSTSRAP